MPVVESKSNNEQDEVQGVTAELASGKPAQNIVPFRRDIDEQEDEDEDENDNGYMKPVATLEDDDEMERRANLQEKIEEARQNALNHVTVDGVEMKRCVNCPPDANLHPIEDFHRDQKSIDGLNRFCADCVNKNNQRLRRERKEKGVVPRTGSRGGAGVSELHAKALERVEEYDDETDMSLDKPREVEITFPDGSLFKISASGVLPKGVVYLVRDAVAKAIAVSNRKRNPFSGF